ncbi:MAG TPA: LytTR family DNA-binding domain-containing protein [Bryobacteraceae bacterium]|jgi:two-component system LytT family response regulator|nr:LytTR family DNA-binding domain-containing protein [Bryobacteraceae bacterium]
MSIRALIVDDEPLARQSIRRFLKNHPDVSVLDECGDGQSAVAAILSTKPDLVFLDVQMPELDGFAVVNRVGVDRMPATIFVTAYDQYALRAFDANALDYLLKPFGKTRFDRALARARERLSQHADREVMRRFLETIESAAWQKSYINRLPVTENGRIVFIRTRDIQWIEAAGNYARLHIASRHLEVRETLTNLEGKLNPREFLRIHRSTIVNLNFVKEIQPWFHGYHLVVLESGHQLRMSRYQQELAVRLGLGGQTR